MTEDDISEFHRRAVHVLRNLEHEGAIVVVDELDARLGIIGCICGGMGIEYDREEAMALVRQVEQEMRG